jgi:hypothetical protein
MISQDTAADIWGAYREIAAAEKLLADMKAEREKPFSDSDKFAPTLKDAFGRKRQLQMGIPSGDDATVLQRAAVSFKAAVKQAKQWDIYGPDWEKNK